jgi:hypothetical protein
MQQISNRSTENKPVSFGFGGKRSFNNEKSAGKESAIYLSYLSPLLPACFELEIVVFLYVAGTIFSNEIRRIANFYFFYFPGFNAGTGAACKKSVPANPRALP